MDFSRRDLVKVLGGATLFSLLPLGWQTIIKAKIRPDEVPGTGSLSAAEIAKVETGEYLSGCARCGVCMTACPQQLIKPNSVMIPVLKEETRGMCPGAGECYVCMEACPTKAIEHALCTPESGYRRLRWNGEKSALLKREEKLSE